MRETVLFWADGGSEIGAGHLMRCAAVAGACRALGLEPVLGTRLALAPQLWEWRALDIAVVDFSAPDEGEGGRAAFDALAARMHARVVVVDRYALAPPFWAGADGPAMVLFDDEGRAEARADLIVNPNPGADVNFAGVYSGAREILLGARFAPIRQGARALAAHPERVILATLGGGGVAEEACALASEIALACPQWSVEVLSAGARDPAWPANLTLHPPGDLAPHLARAGLVLCAGGVTALEAASLGAPMIVTVRAANQSAGAQALAQAGAARLASSHAQIVAQARALAADPQARAALSHAARALIDGRGAERIAAALARLARAGALTGQERT